MVTTGHATGLEKTLFKTSARLAENNSYSVLRLPGRQGATVWRLHDNRCRGVYGGDTGVVTANLCISYLH